MKKKDIKILLVDDEQDILEIVGYNLSLEGYQIVTASNGREAIVKAKKEQPDLIIMDVMMPEMDGMEFCAQLRANAAFDRIIVCFLTARNEDYSQIAGLDSGADDYIAKPVKPRVLISRIKALLRRSEKNTTLPQELNGLIINREEYVASLNGEKIHLPKKEFELLALLASKPGNVFERDVILDTVWGSDIIVGDRTIDVHIRKLREKIGDDFIKTVKGVGYKFKID